jgi:tetratricopeptide (TPR) repeat protein
MPRFLIISSLLLSFCDRSDQTEVLSKIREGVLSLEYSAETADDFAEMAGRWRNRDHQKVLDSWINLLGEKRESYKTGEISPGALAEIEEEIIREISETILKEIRYHNDYYRLEEVISSGKANCLGYVQAGYIIGNSLGLSVEAVNVLELHNGLRAYREGRGYHHTACLFTLSDSSSLFLDLAYDLGGGNRVSSPFVKDHVYKEDGNYLLLKKGVDAPGVHRKIQVLDEKGIVSLAWFQKGVDYSKGELYDSASVCFVTALHYNPTLAEAYNNLGIVYTQLGQYGSARICFHKCLVLNRTHANAYYNLGNEYFRTNQTTEALEHYSKAIELDSLHAKAYLYRGIGFASIGKKEEAARDLVRAGDLDSSLTSKVAMQMAEYGLKPSD